VGGALVIAFVAQTRCQTIPFLKKQTQFFAVSSLKSTICRKTKPIQTQFKPNSNPIFRSKSNSCQFVEFVVKSYTFLCKTNPNFPVSSSKTTIFPQNEPKTNPNKANVQNSQNEP
jgi:hypothetical protein